MQHDTTIQRVSDGASSSPKTAGSPAIRSHNEASDSAARGPQKKRVCFDAVTQAMPEPPYKRLKQASSLALQEAPGLIQSTSSRLPPAGMSRGLSDHAQPPDPLDADPLDLMASQSHLLDSIHASKLERGNSSNCQDLDKLGPPSIQELQVGRTETAGSNGRPDTRDKGSEQETTAQQQMQQLKKQHRLQLQERNRQICHLQEDREKLRRSLRKAEDELRDAQDTAMCTVCHKTKRNCLILPCLHFLLCAGCLQQHTASCPFCPACNTKVSGLMVLLTTV